MPRRREVPKRTILPDPKFNSQLLAKFINVLMYSGKKSIAEGITYGALAIMLERLKKAKKTEDSDSSSGQGSNAQLDVLQLFEEALNNVKPGVEVRSRRVGGATYQIPVEVRADRGMALAMRWIIESARKGQGKDMMNSLAEAFVEAFQKRGLAVKKREDTHKMAKANQAFAHYRWN
jgi:small subunit ribosomal protein S7